VVKLAGDLSAESAGRLRDATAPLRSDERPVVVDAAALEFVDSRGVNELCALARGRGRPIGILTPQHVVRNLLTLLDLATLLPVIQTIDPETLLRLRAPLADEESGPAEPLR
jgi:anti-anti-sigma factor